MHEKPHFNNKLSKREMEVLKEMVKGKTNKDIAKVYLYLRKQLKHMSVIYLINYKFQIEHKLLYMLLKIN